MSLFTFSPKMSYGVLECNIVMLQNHMLMVFNKTGVVIKRGVICARPYILFLNIMSWFYKKLFMYNDKHPNNIFNGGV